MFQPVGSWGVGMIMLGWWAWTTVTYRKAGQKVGISGWIVGAIALLMQLVTAGEKLAVLTILFGATWIVTTYSYVKGSSSGGLLELLLTPIWIAWEYLRGVRRVIGSFWGGEWVKSGVAAKTQVKRVAWVKAVLRGVVISLPVVAWLVSLLSQADPIFANFVKNIVSEEFLRQLPIRLVWSGAILIVMLPMLKFAWREYVSPLRFLASGWEREMSVVLLMVTIVLGSFLVVQWPYVFAQVARETDLSQFGVATYSEYVKKGFGDLLQVTALVLAVSWAGLLVGKGKLGQSAKWLLILQGMLGTEFVIFVISIFRRVWLYQSLHGLTLARLYGLVALIWLAGMMGTMVMRYVQPGLRWVKYEILWTLLVVGVGIMGNLERVVVADPPTVNGRVDYVYLARMSEDGYTGWAKAYEHTASELARIVGEKLPGIGVDNRREIYYGSLVLQQLVDNYDRLVWKYGTEEEIKDYLHTILDWEEAMLAEYPEIATSRVSGGREQIMQAISEARKMSIGDDWKKTGLVPQSGSRYYQVGTYKFEGYDQGFYGLWDQEYITNFERDRLMKPWGKWLSSSYRERVTYQQLSQDVPIAELLATIKDYWKLRLQIRMQPETERTVEIDISFESPLR